jgi:ATP-binding cassette subfamily F protein uup
MLSDVILTLEDISKSIGDKLIFSDISLGIHAQEKIGVVGINGCGKTTLLNVISGSLDPSSGTITPRKELKIGYLGQDPDFDPGHSVLDHVLSVAESDPERDREYESKSVLTQLGVTTFDKSLGLLSGGQRRKADLARVLVRDPDLLILDEPTNHLDLDTIEWLQEYLARLKKAVIFVTHDRYFLDAVCTRVWELEKGRLFSHEGNYSDYVRGRIVRATDLQRKEKRRQAQLKKELDWLGRGAKARSSKPKNHVDRVRELISKSYLISNAELDISFQTSRLGKTILELHRLSKSYSGIELFRDIDHHFQARERIGVIGANGCGKTTLLRIITGEEEPDLGSVKVGLNTRFAYYRQEEESFDPALSVYDYIAQYAEVIKTRDGTKLTATEMLKRFLIDGRMQQQKLGSLSGGERKRLFLLKALIFGANFIILDEPTNDLDIRTLEILEDYLDAFHGCLIVVSHDRFFLDRSVDTLFVFEGTSIRKFPGNYSDYLLVRKFLREEEEEKAAQPVILRPRRSQKGLSYNQQREYDLITSRIDEIEAIISTLEDKLNRPDPAWTPQDYSDLSDRLEALNLEHQDLLQRWLELSDLKNLT